MMAESDHDHRFQTNRKYSFVFFQKNILWLVFTIRYFGRNPENSILRNEAREFADDDNEPVSALPDEEKDVDQSHQRENKD